jgi:hypothetical protein
MSDLAHRRLTGLSENIVTTNLTINLTYTFQVPTVMYMISSILRNCMKEQYTNLGEEYILW